MKTKFLLVFPLWLITALLYSQEWISLYNGKDLKSWEQVGDGNFVIEEGILKTQGGMGLLYFKDQSFENVVLRVVYKNPGGKNAGVFIRIPERPEDPWMPVNKGFEVQIDDHGDDYHCTGVLYSISKAQARPSVPDSWNTMEITLDRDITKVSINGELVTEYREGQQVPEKKIWYEPERGPRPRRGYIGLQNHGDEDVVYFKEVSYRKLNPVRQEEFWAHRFSTQQDISYGDDPQQRVDIYMQGAWIGEPTYFKPTENARPTLVYFHGGGWVGGTKETQAGFIMPYIQRGWNVVNVEYRLGPDTAPDAAEDVLSAMKWISENADSYNIDRNNIVVSGGSAGGHLCLLAGLVNSVPGSHQANVGDQLKIKAIVNWFGITDIEKVEDYLSSTHPEWNYAIDWIGEKDKVSQISKKYSPIHFVTPNAPPVLTIHGEEDEVVPFDQAKILHEALDVVGDRHRLLSLPGGKHLGFTEEQFQHIYTIIFEFLDMHVDF